MRTIRVIAALAALAAPAATLAQDRACAAADSKAAEQALDRVVNWELLHKAWKEFGHCDSGAVNEAFTEAFLRVAVQWKNVEQFAPRYQGEAQFKAFINRHIASPAAKDDVDALYSRAKSDCPSRLAAFCEEFAQVAKGVMDGPAPAPAAPAAPAAAPKPAAK